MKATLVLLLCISVILGSTQPIFAQEALPSNAPAQDIPPAVREQLERKNRYENAIRRMEQQLTVGPDGLLALKVARGSDIGVPDTIFDELKAGMQFVNGQIRTGNISIEEVLLSSGEKVRDKKAPRVPLSASSASAQVATFNAPGQNIPPAVREQLERKNRFEKAIRSMERHLSVGQDGLLHLNVARGSDIDVPGNIFDELQASMQALNGQVQAGAIGIEEVLLNSGERVIDKKAPRAPLSTSSASAQVAAFNALGWDGPRSVQQQLESVPRDHNGPACIGRTGIDWLWYGPRIYLNSCHTEAWVIAVGAGGAVGTALCVLITSGTILGLPVSAVCALVGTIATTVTVATIQAISALGGHHGIYIQFTWVALIGQWQYSYMWHQ